MRRQSVHHLIVYFLAAWFVFFLIASTAYATCGARGGPGFRGPDGKCVSWATIGRVCGSPPTQRCTAEGTNAGADEAADYEVKALQAKRPKPTRDPQQSEQQQ